MLSSIHSLIHWFRSDGRHFQIVSQLLFLGYGILVLNWDTDVYNFIAAFAGTVGTQLLFIRRELAPWHSLRSALITALGLSLLLKANSPLIFFFAGSIAIGQKFAFRINGKHLWNPAAFGIVVAILLSGDAWVSPAQWGSAAILVFIIATAGLAVLSRVGRLETGMAFILTLIAAEYIRTVLFLGWEHDFFLHKLSSGALWLFAFFMITDPMTIPANRMARIVWASGVALVSFYLSNFHFINAAPIWVLVCATPLSPLIDRLVRGELFQWRLTKTSAAIPTLQSTSNSPNMKHALSILLLSLAIFGAGRSSAFCGFYVAKADATLFNNKSEVILVRDGLRTVITMSNDFKGDVRDFAMVVPVPLVLKEQDIRVVNRRIFEALDAYSAPRLAEYYDPEPCPQVAIALCDNVKATRSTSVEEMPSYFFSEAEEKGVTIEAQYEIGEYDILILSAKESTGLRDWLIANGYKIPPTADEVLDPYIKSNTKFFVVKVNLDRMRASGFDYLNPIQIAFDHEKFMLPIRLGMANSTGVQDMIVYAFTRTGRVECTNYRTVKMPTGRNIPLFVKNEFGEFYKNVFDKSWKSEGRNSVMLEYAWNVSPQQAGVKCDPCVGPPPIYQDFADAGVWWASNWNSPDNVFFTRLHVRYSRDKFPADLQFQVTPNNENYQARYVLNNPANGPFDCREAQAYLETLRDRRTVEMEEYTALTGRQDARAYGYIHGYDKYLRKENKDRKEGESDDVQKGKQPVAPRSTGKGPNPPSDEPTGAIQTPNPIHVESAPPANEEPTAKASFGNLILSGIFMLSSLAILLFSRIRRN
ncbi:MAG: DUF2330 domain-containing protein [Flavobacteriales bacterium]